MALRQLLSVQACPEDSNCPVGAYKCQMQDGAMQGQNALLWVLRVAD